MSTASRTGDPTADATARIHGLDWLRVGLVFGVFLFHALHPFDAIPWVIKNDQTSFAITGVLMLFFPWGLPVLFLVAGAAAHLAAGRRRFADFARERTWRLLVPFLVGTAFLAPFQSWVVARHQGVTTVGFVAWIPEWLDSLPFIASPAMVSQWGWHLWFLGFLFMFALLTWPFEEWTRGRGRETVARVARWVDGHRGSTLLGVVPLILVRELLHPIAPLEHGWTDFAYYLVFYAYGLVMLQDPAFLRGVRRDWPWGLAMALVGVMTIGGGTGSGLIADAAWEPMAGPTTGSLLLNFAMPLAAWGAGVGVVALAVARWNTSTPLLRYGQSVVVPFYVVHQPVVIAVAAIVVATTAGLWIKVAATLVVSLAVTMLIVEAARRTPRVGRFLGIKQPPRSGARPSAHDPERPVTIAGERL